MLLTEQLAVVGTIDPDAYGTGTYLTDAIALKDFRSFAFLVKTGDMGSGATVNFSVVGATSEGGSYTALSTVAITALTQAGSDGDKQAWIVVSPIFIESLGLGYTHIKGELVIGTQSVDADVTAFGFGPRFGPATDFDLASVDEIVLKVN